MKIDMKGWLEKERINKGDNCDALSNFQSDLESNLNGLSRNDRLTVRKLLIFDFNWTAVGNGCYKAAFLGMPGLRKLSRLSFANLCLALSRIRDPFDSELEQLGSEPLLGRRFLEEMRKWDDSLPKIERMSDRLIILRSDLNVQKF